MGTHNWEGTQKPKDSLRGRGFVPDMGHPNFEELHQETRPQNSCFENQWDSCPWDSNTAANWGSAPTELTCRLTCRLTLLPSSHHTHTWPSTEANRPDLKGIHLLILTHLPRGRAYWDSLQILRQVGPFSHSPSALLHNTRMGQMEIYTFPVPISPILWLPLRGHPLVRFYIE